MKKFNQLKKFLANLESAVVAFSGGVDSGLLIKAAYDVLGKKAVAVTASSIIHSRQDLEAAKVICKNIGIKHIVTQTDELSNLKFRRNCCDRCYWCKRNLILKLKDIADKTQIKYILDGTNYDDKNDVRPGIRANKELGVISPLSQCRFGKEDIIELAKYLRLSFWDKPKGTCFSSRIPFGEEITIDRIKRVISAEDILKDILGGGCIVRARDHNDILRIELGNREGTKLKKSDINRVMFKLKKLGY
ncbi:MAG: ATP-dependent sacrificial sulfur transferase LarE, partial [Candidatus Omnitrophota bacterium]